MNFHAWLRAIKKKRAQFALGLFSIFFILTLNWFSWSHFQYFLKGIDNFFYDAMVRTFPHPMPTMPRVIVVDIDNESIKKVGRWPWPRDKIAELLNNLSEAGVVVTAFDIVFSQSEDNLAKSLLSKINPNLLKNSHFRQEIENLAPQIDNDQKFAAQLAKNEAVLGFLLHDQSNLLIGKLPPPLLNNKGEVIDAANLTVPSFSGYSAILPLFAEADKVGGFVSNIPDDDGVIRNSLLLAKFNNKLYPSLSLATVMRYLMVDKIQLEATKESNGKEKLLAFEVSGIRVPVNERGQILMPFWGPANTIPYYSAVDILDKKVANEDLAGSIAIVGSTLIILADLHPTPISPVFPGVESNANIIAMLLSQQFTEQAIDNVHKEYQIIFMLGFILSFILPLIGPVLTIISYVFLAGFCLAFSWWLFVTKNIYLPIAIILVLLTTLVIANFFYEFIIERRQKNKIRQLFGQYVPPSHITEMTDFPESYNMEGDTRVMSVFFSDIRDFTSISEKLTANGVKKLLNDFLTPLTKIIFDNQGTIDKYVGDMVVAFWGAPLRDPNHAHHAVGTALDIKKALPDINQTLNEIDLPTVQMGMGIATGAMNVGDMGSEFRRAYTVLGDTVNLGSRLEALTKYYQVDILVCEFTKETAPQYVWQYIDKIRVKGRSQPLAIYEPLGKALEVNQVLDDELAVYEKAIASYLKQDWDAAINEFQQLIKGYKDKYLYHYYLARIDELKTANLGADWDGTFTHTQK